MSLYIDYTGQEAPVREPGIAFILASPRLGIEMEHYGHLLEAHQERELTEGGTTVFDNLCLACRTCNEYKTDAIESLDPVTGRMMSLFHPRQQIWSEDFLPGAKMGPRRKGLPHLDPRGCCPDPELADGESYSCDHFLIRI